MALLIKGSCINCDMCDPEYPYEAIKLGGEIYEINPEKCTECVGHYDKAQCLLVCPMIVFLLMMNLRKMKRTYSLSSKFAPIYS